MKKSILMVTEEMIPSFRRFCITERSAEFSSRDFDVHLAYIASNKESYKFRGIKKHPVRMGWNQFNAIDRVSAQAKLFRKTMEVCMNEKIDLVYGWWLPTYLACRLTRKKLVTDMPEFGEEMYRTFSFPMKKIIANTIYNYQMDAANYSEAVIVESEAAARIWQRRGIAKEKLHVLPYGVEVEKFYKAKAGISRKRFGIPEDEPMLLFYGDMGYDDGVDILLRAIKGMDVWCLCIGDGPSGYMKKLKKLASKKTVFSNWIYYQDIPSIVKSSDICVSPFRSTKYSNTTFPLKITESMAAERPVISSRLMALTEQMRDGYNIKFFKPGSVSDLRNSIKRLLASDSTRRKIGRNAKKTAFKKFDWMIRAKAEKEIFKISLGMD